MATITAAAGGGNWNNTATWIGGVIPTTADDVQLTNTSGNVTITTTATCRSLDCTGYTATLTHNAGVALNIGGTTAGAGNRALLFSSTMTYTLGNSRTSAITFVSTATTQQTVTTNGKTLGDLTFNAHGGNILLSDSLTSSGIIALTAGTLDTGSQNVTAASLYSGIGGSTTRTLTLGSSAITLTVTAGNGLWSGDNNGGVTFTPNNATITFTGSTGSANMSNANLSGTTIIFSSSVVNGGIFNGGSYKDFTFIGGTNRFTSLKLSGNLTLSGSLTLTGGSATSRINVTCIPVGTTRFITAAAVSLANVDFQDITAAGAAVPFSGTSLGDCLGNSNITFTPATTQTYAVGAAGTWSDSSKWTTRVPLPQDDVIVTGATTGTLIADMPRLGRDITFTGFAGTVNFSGSFSAIYGSWTSAAAMTQVNSAGLDLLGRGSHTITTNGAVFPQNINVIALNGSYTLQDSLTTNAAVFANGGAFNTNDQTVTCSHFSSLAIATVNLGSSTLNLTHTGAVNIFVTNGAVINAGTSNIVIATTSTSNRNFYGSNGLALHSLTYTVPGSTGALTISGSMAINTLNVSDSANTRSVRFGTGATYTITNFNARGSAGKMVSLSSVTPGVTATLSKTAGYVDSDYLSLQDITATGGASWYAGANSTNVSNVNGWFFQAYSPSRFLEFI